MKKAVSFKVEDGCEVRVLEDYGPGSPAVRVTWGYSTGSDTGLHSFLGTFACAELGILDEDSEFMPVVWEESDRGKHIFSKSLVGCPKECEGWDPTGNEINWDDFEKWVDDYCNRVL